MPYCKVRLKLALQVCWQEIEMFRACVCVANRQNGDTFTADTVLWRVKTRGQKHCGLIIERAVKFGSHDQQHHDPHSLQQCLAAHLLSVVTSVFSCCYRQHPRNGMLSEELKEHHRQSFGLERELARIEESEFLKPQLEGAFSLLEATADFFPCPNSCFPWNLCTDNIFAQYC